MISQAFWIEWLLFNQNVIGFASITLHDWLNWKHLAPLFSSNQKQNQNQSWLARTRFPAVFTSATCTVFEFWLVHCIVCVLCDWLELSLWFWFYDTPLRAESLKNCSIYGQFALRENRWTKCKCSQFKKKWGTAKTHAAVSTKVVPQKVTTCAIMSIVVIMGRLRFTLF